jgi:hypothetical protein
MVIEYLFNVCQETLTLNFDIQPPDLCSTSALDSFIETISHVIRENLMPGNMHKLFDEMHLATGTRTNFCKNILNFIILHQNKEQILTDAVEFF